MTTIIMLFFLPLGILLHFFDKKTRRINRESFNNYVSKIEAADLSQKEKLDKIDEMYYQNDYTIVSRTDEILIIEKKHFDLGILFVFFGLLSYFGLPLYYLYYRFILKPERIEIRLKTT